MTTKVHAGRDVSLAFGPLVDQSGAAIDMSGSASAEWWMGKTAYATGANVYAKKDSASGGIVFTSTTTNGVTLYTANVQIAPTDTENVAPTPTGQNYYHELEIKDATGRDYTYDLSDSGAFQLLPSLIPPA